MFQASVGDIVTVWVKEIDTKRIESLLKVSEETKKVVQEGILYEIGDIFFRRLQTFHLVKTFISFYFLNMMQ